MAFETKYTLEQIAMFQPISVETAAQLTGLSTNSVRAYLNRGTLQGIKVGGVWIVEPNSLHSMIHNPRRPGRPKTTAVSS